VHTRSFAACAGKWKGHLSLPSKTWLCTAKGRRGLGPARLVARTPGANLAQMAVSACHRPESSYTRNRQSQLLKLAQDCNRPRGQGNAMFAACLHAVGWHRPDFLVEVNFGPRMKLKIFVFFKIYGLNPRKNPDPSRPLGAGQPAAPFAGDHRTPGNPHRNENSWLHYTKKRSHFHRPTAHFHRPTG
jgi:hypothetical protein